MTYILITNDDGIDSPGLAAVVGALDDLGELLVVAPRVQQTSMGRARSQNEGRDGRLFKREISVGERRWPAFAQHSSSSLHPSSFHSLPLPPWGRGTKSIG